MGCCAQELFHRADHGALIARLGRRLGGLTPFRIALLATLAIVIAYLPASRLGLVRELEGKALDLRTQLRPPLPPSDDIVLVMIDDATSTVVARFGAAETMAEYMELLGRCTFHVPSRPAAGHPWRPEALTSIWM